MTHVSRPLIALLLGTVVFFALWTIALKPSSSSNGGGSKGVGQYQSAINQARGVQGVVNGAAARAGGTATSTAQSAPTSQPATASQTATPTHSATAAPPATTAPARTPVHPSHSGHRAPAATGLTIASLASAGRAVATVAPVNGPAAAIARPTGMKLVKLALHQHKVIALLFYNPASADDRAVKHELASIRTHRGAVVKLAVSLHQLGSYSVLLNDVPVNFSPSLVLIDRARQAEVLAGFADAFEIDQRVSAILVSGHHKH